MDNHQMNHPPVVELEKKAGCRYMLVTAVAKRARQLLIDNDEAETNEKPVSRAVDELYADQLRIEYPSEYFQTSEK